MNKTELVKKVAAENELTQKTAAAVVDYVLNSVMDSLAAREPVSLFGFGTFTCKHRDERTGRPGKLCTSNPDLPYFSVRSMIRPLCTN